MCDAAWETNRTEQKAIDNLFLLLCQVLLQGVYQSCENEHLKECLQQIQEDPVTSLSAEKLQRDVGEGDACFLNLDGKTSVF